MLLVAGLAVAGLVGIAAAFYFSIRSGHGGDKRLRSGRSGRSGRAGATGTGGRPGSRSHGTARPGRFEENGRRPANGGRPANAGRGANVASRDYLADSSTGPNPVLDFRDPALVVGRRGSPGTPGDAHATDPRPGAVKPREPLLDDSRAADSRVGASRVGSRSAARLSREAHTARGADKAGKMGKPRRRVGFRKGADVDEEMWPAEAFGGVSDEQFWDDLASDKPLATTARTAQQDPGPRNRLLDAAPSGDTQAVQAKGDNRARDPRTRDDGARDERARAEGRRGAGSGAYPESRTEPNPATERTMVQPSYAATQPVRSMTSQSPGVTQPSETRGRRRASSIDDEDPLTSAAFSLRASGPVDGRSSRRSRDATREQYGEPRPGGSRSGGPGPGSGGGYGVTSPYPYAGTSYGDPSPVTQAMDSTPPYGENYGYGSGDPVAPADDQRRPGGTGSHARHGGNGEGSPAARAARRAYPQDGSQSTGSYPAGGYAPGDNQGNGYQAGGHQGNGHQADSYQAGGYQGNGRPVGSHRAPYDPREDYRRLTHPR